VQGLPRFDDPNLLVGAEHFSDAGVYRLADGLAIVQSVDFFPPLVDDPFLFGQIAAANSLSDLYAMGARPVTAMNIVGFPDKDAPLEILQRILAGGAERIIAAGAVIVGGHSVRDTEIKYGMAVTGIIDPKKMMTNAAARPGDVLVLTKPLGTGFITTANRAGKCPEDTLKAACASMARLNKDASEHAVALGAKAATDITGFGLAGHALEMALASDVTIELTLERLPLLPGVEVLAKKGHHTRANATNRAHAESSLSLVECEKNSRVEFLFDPQTSGGLLVAIDAPHADELVARCRAAGLTDAAIVGHVIEKSEHALVVHG